MNAGQSFQLLSDRRDVIVDLWYKVIARTGFVSLTAVEVRRQLASFMDQIIEALATEPFPRHVARAVGAALARLHYIQPEALGGTLEVLACEFTEAVSSATDGAKILQPRLNTLLGELAAGFFGQARSTILREQEEVRGALFIARRAADAALKASEVRFRSAFDNAAIGMGLFHPDGRWLQVNHSLCGIVGFCEQELLQTTIQAVTYPDDVGTDSTYMHQLLMDEVTSYQIEKRFVHKHGQIVWVLLSVSLVRDADGEPRYFIAQIQDITERKRATEALEAERRQLQNVIDSAPVAMAMFDRDMRYLAHSARWVTNFGKQGQWLVGRPAFDAEPDLLKPWSAFLEPALAGESFMRPEDVWQQDDGSVIYLRWAMTPWYTAEGEVGGVVIATHRIDELVEAREAALEASRLKSEFLAKVSHEIRTPMNAILGTTDLMFTTSLSTEQRELATILRNSAHGLLAIIDDILDFSKAEVGKLALVVDDFEPSLLVESTVDLLLSSAREQETSLMTFVAPEVPPILRGDAGRLRQILINLIGNAVKFTKCGEVVVRATVAAATPSHVTVHFAVHDTGIGLSDADRKQLFQPFVQVDGSTTRQYGGTGLGLAISKQLVELMGGAIGVDSVEGNGSTFWFTVPLERSSASPPRTPPAASVLRGLRALVLESSKTHREIVRRYLEMYGMRADEAATLEQGWSALRAASKDPYSVVLVSALVVGIDPFSMVREIHDEPALAQVRLILISALDEPRRGAEVLRAGLAGYLPMPVKQASLLDVVLGAVGPAHAPETVATRSGEPTPVSQRANDVLSRGAQDFEQTILVAEDNPINQKLARLQLQHMGYQAEVVNNGREAVDALAARPYALVLMDCQMPVMDGYEAARTIRQAEQGTKRHVPIVAMTAYAMPGQREESLAAGMDDHVSKPVRAEQLQAVIARYLYREPAPRSVGLSDHLDDVPVLDPAVLERWQHMHPAGGSALVNEIVDVFLAETPAILRTIRIAVMDGDAARLEQGAHRCAGSSANVGARRLFILCNKLEALGRAGTTVGADEHLAHLPAEYERVKEALEQVRG